MRNLTFAFAGLFIFLLSCSQPKANDPVCLVTPIQYDVLLKNPDTLPDYRHRYMDDSTGSLFLQAILEPVVAGQIKGYVWDNNKLVPGTPFIDPVNVSKIRYYEEWSLHKKSLMIDKKIKMIALIKDDYDPSGEFRGTRPLLYIFYDPAFVAEYERMCLKE